MASVSAGGLVGEEAMEEFDGGWAERSPWPSAGLVVRSNRSRRTGRRWSTSLSRTLRPVSVRSGLSDVIISSCCPK